MQVGPEAQDGLDRRAETLIRQVLNGLEDAEVEFLVGGAFAMARHAGIMRWTKDIDLFVRPHLVEATLEVFAELGGETELTDARWLGKAKIEDLDVDLVFSSANGLCDVDDLWFEHAPRDVVAGVPVSLCPPEEMIWQKAFILERERYDGADVTHLLRTQAASLDWRRLLDRFGGHSPVLLSHLILFGYIYPVERTHVPRWVFDELNERLRYNQAHALALGRICRGTLVSRTQYRIDIDDWGYVDARNPASR